jgi:hypothetical protein
VQLLGTWALFLVVVVLGHEPGSNNENESSAIIGKPKTAEEASTVRACLCNSSDPLTMLFLQLQGLFDLWSDAINGLPF